LVAGLEVVAGESGVFGVDQTGVLVVAGARVLEEVVGR